MVRTVCVYSVVPWSDYSDAMRSVRLFFVNRRYFVIVISNTDRCTVRCTVLPSVSWRLLGIGLDRRQSMQLKSTEFAIHPGSCCSVNFQTCGGSAASPWNLATLSGHVSQLMESEPTEAELAAFMADEEVVLELQSLQGILASSPALANPHPEIVAGVKVAVRVQAVDPEGSRQRVVAQRVQEAVKSTPETTPPEATPPETTPPEATPPETAPPEATASDPGWLTEMFSELDEGRQTDRQTVW